MVAPGGFLQVATLHFACRSIETWATWAPVYDELVEVSQIVMETNNLSGWSKECSTHPIQAVDSRRRFKMDMFAAKIRCIPMPKLAVSNEIEHLSRSKGSLGNSISSMSKIQLPPHIVGFAGDFSWFFHEFSSSSSISKREALMFEPSSWRSRCGACPSRLSSTLISSSFNTYWWFSSLLWKNHYS